MVVRILACVDIASKSVSSHLEELLICRPRPLPRQGRFLTRILGALKPLQRSLARASVCCHVSHIPFGPQRPCATPLCSRRSRLRFGIRAVPTSHSGRSTVFSAVQGFHLAGFNTHKCSPAAPTSLPGSSVWNLFFSLAI